MEKSHAEKIISPETNQEARVINDINTLKEVVDELKRLGKKVVYTSGVFDMYHIGHALYLEKAKEQGDILLVGLDSDELTKKRKGPSRPIVPLDERLSLLIRSRSVDIVSVRDADDDITMLIKEVRPDVLVISSSTKDTDNFVEEMRQEFRPFYKEFIVFEPQAETSTTARIRKLSIDGATNLAKKIKELTEEYLLGKHHE